MLLERTPAFQDVQSAWLILLHCAAARANYLLRVVRPALVKKFEENHDAGVVEICAKYCTSRKISVKPQQGPPAQCLWCWVGWDFGPQ